ncbi:MAG: DNA-deoxyinosine glycosylase [Rhodanobacteraceae bacterium]|nr:DNA-deoxyinosine glycosylase [Rhodanobacteraceae bacterium]MBL0040137.1 DNA-deoxyinosine glycosylase [Xanthomonadales bacterium]MBP6078507.1 DNA-deoxyinosine glycosylase [Xanthomonadales bacterium]MBP7624110.1 DNA-deoxyinosine glycosylase [Xanthomonadales bacterium]
MQARSFPPLIAAHARVLILGSMPGVASLRAQQYYAHPRNQFWPILGELLGFDPSADYALRVQALHRAGIAVWDVLAECERDGSLDSAIDTMSEQPNDVPGLLAAHPSIRRILFNGHKAASSLRRHFPGWSVEGTVLPSTSPAHASIAASGKSEIWRRAVRAALAASNAQPHFE